MRIRQGATALPEGRRALLDFGLSERDTAFSGRETQNVVARGCLLSGLGLVAPIQDGSLLSSETPA